MYVALELALCISRNVVTAAAGALCGGQQDQHACGRPGAPLDILFSLRFVVKRKHTCQAQRRDTVNLALFGLVAGPKSPYSIPKSANTHLL